MKIKAKFTIIVAILVGIFSLTTFFAFSDYKKSIKETIAQQQFRMVSILADEIDGKLLSAQQNLIAVARTAPSDIMQNPEKAQAFLDNKPILYTIFDNHLFLFTPAGKIFVESPYAPDRRGSDVSLRDYIIETLKTKKPFISVPYVSSQPHKHPVVMLAVPLFDGKGKITGILTGGIDLMRDNFLGRISTVRIGKEGYLYLTATDRTLIMHADRKRILTKQAPGLNRLYDRAIEGFEGTDETITSHGIQMVTSFKRLKTKNWILAANYPQAEAYRPIQVAEQYFLIATITGIVAIFFIISFIIKYLINPFELFTRHVEDLPKKAGDDRFLNIKTKDEFGTLSLAFNKMVSEIDKRSELGRSEELYRTITEFSTDFVFWRYSVNKLIYVSENCEKFCGYTERELYALPELLETMIHPDDRTIWEEHSKGILEPIELRIVTKSGEVRWISHSCLPVYDKQGNYRGERGSHRDITERKQAEEALKELAQRFELAAASGQLGIWDWNVVSSFMVWNDRMFELYGIPRDEFPNSVQAWVNGLHPDDSAKAIAECEAALRGEKEFDTEFRVMHPDGTVKVIKANAIVIRDADGKAVRMLGLNRDITELREAEEKLTRAYSDLEIKVQERTAELSAAKHKLEELNLTLEQRVRDEIASRQEKEHMLFQQSRLAAMGEMIGAIAHQWRQPLNAIGLIIQNLQMAYEYDQLNTERLRNSVGTAMWQVNFMSKTIDDFRNFFKPSKEREIFDVREVVDETIFLMKAQLQNNYIDIEIISEKEGLAVNGYTNEFKHVLLNLINNAKDAILVRKAKEKCQAKITIQISEEHDKVILRVRDTGGGIPEGIMNKIFDPYFTTKDEGTGTGIGLYISKTMIERNMGGQLTVQNWKEGAEFRLEV
ncbi:MAG: PAS domain-containing protein [Nitrospirae bacterium]|nr:PAS domain-containing protein [Nitrospirota bacterium]